MNLNQSAWQKWIFRSCVALLAASLLGCSSVNKLGKAVSDVAGSSIVVLETLESVQVPENFDWSSTDVFNVEINASPQQRVSFELQYRHAEGHLVTVDKGTTLDDGSYSGRFRMPLNVDQFYISYNNKTTSISSQGNLIAHTMSL